MNRSILSIYFVILIFGVFSCSTTRINPKDAKFNPNNQVKYKSKLNENQAKVTVFRDSGVFGSACDNNIFIDNEFIGKIGLSEKNELYLEPGKYILRIDIRSSGMCMNMGIMDQINLDVKKKDDQYYRVKDIKYIIRDNDK